MTRGPASMQSEGNMRPGAREKETPACSRNEGSSSAVPLSPGGLPLVVAVGRLSGRSSPGGCRWTPRGLRLPGLDATPAARRTHAVGSLGAPAPGGGGAAARQTRRRSQHRALRALLVPAGLRAEAQRHAREPSPAFRGLRPMRRETMQTGIRRARDAKADQHGVAVEVHDFLLSITGACTRER